MELNDKNLDRWLDGALQRYGNVEPRTGLESRILANLEAAAQVRRHGRGWWWAWGAAALMACIAVAMWVGIDMHHLTKRTVATTNPATVGASAKGSQPAPLQVAHLPHRVKRHSIPPNIEAAKQPRLEQFPSARPLSEQEQLLARYVRELPEEAVLVAQAQAESQKELDRLIADEFSN